MEDLTGGSHTSSSIDRSKHSSNEKGFSRAFGSICCSSSETIEVGVKESENKHGRVDVGADVPTSRGRRATATASKCTPHSHSVLNANGRASSFISKSLFSGIEHLSSTQDYPFSLLLRCLSSISKARSTSSHIFRPICDSTALDSTCYKPYWT